MLNEDGSGKFLLNGRQGCRQFCTPAVRFFDSIGQAGEWLRRRNRSCDRSFEREI